jgi:two-component system CheB/CheR fusion protein
VDTARTETILTAIRNATGHDFSQYKKSTIGRRIERRMALHHIDDMAEYERYLARHSREVQALFKELLINVTSFFRDPEVFRILRQEILPALCADQPESYVFRVWVVGCSTGEEAYSIAIVLREFMDETGAHCKIQIYATDLDDDAINTARMGQYPPNIAQDVTPERLQRHFTKIETGYRVKKDIREMVVFAVHNVIKDPPFTRLDLASCRNLMIYLEPELQLRLIPALHYALKPGGILLLSPSEGIGKHTDLFAQVNRKWKLYRAVRTAAASRALTSSGLAWTQDSRSHLPAEIRQKADSLNIAELSKRALLQAYAPASVLTDLAGNILYVYGETGAYLSPAQGPATLNVLEMTRDGLQFGLRAAINRATGEKLATLGCEVPLTRAGDLCTISLSVRPISDPALAEGLLMISFAELAAIPAIRPHGKRRGAQADTLRIEALERDLDYTRQNLQATIEEQQATNEELKSANEEMQSSNEELQSVNEELETSKEEMQSVNEELVTVNAELQNKIEQLSDMQNDMKNLLENINIGTLFLDDRLNIRRFTLEAMRAYRLTDADIGRPLGDIKSDLVGGDLLSEAQGVLDTLIAYEGQVETIDGAIFLARIQPYRTLDNVIAGVVLTFTDLSQRVAAERIACEQLAQAIVDTVREPLLVLDGAFRVISASRSFYRFFEVTAEATIGHSLFELGNRQWDIPALRDQLETVLPRDQSFEDFTVSHVFPQIGQLTVVLNARRLQTPYGSTPMILLAMELPFHRGGDKRDGAAAG